MTRAFRSSQISLAAAVLAGSQLFAQSTPTPSVATAQAASNPAAGTYSIEAEIFAYKSLASNSAQIASEVVGLTTIVSQPEGASRPLTTHRGVVIVPSVSVILPAFQAWRSNLLVMQNYLNQATPLTAPGAAGCPAPSGRTVAPSFAAYATGVSQAVGVIQSIISLFANNDSVTEYPGTIQDQALMSGVARELRVHQSTVLTPDLFAPWTIDIPNAVDSPFVSKLGDLIRKLMQLQDVYQCNQITLNAASQLQQAEITRAADFAKLADPAVTPANRITLVAEIRAMKAQIDYSREKLGLDTAGAGIMGPENDIMDTELPILNNANSSDAQKAAALTVIRRNDAGIIALETPRITTATLTSAKVQAIAAGIQSYLAGLTGGAVNLPAPVAPAPASPAPSAAAPAPSANPPAAPAPAAASPASSTPPILAVLQADGLARRMNVRADDWNFDAWRILWVKSLESGGATVMHSNIFGAHPHFSGGAVSAYALFQLDGTLVCSGNVGAYAGYVDPKHFMTATGAAVQMIPLGPGCGK